MRRNVGACACVWQLSWLTRFFIGCAGATFVTNQFWCSLMFAPNVVGTANATAAGRGNLGGGVTQIFMMSVLRLRFSNVFVTEASLAGLSGALARMSLII